MSKTKEVSAEVLSLSALLKPKSSEDNATVSFDKKSFEDNLPEGVTIDVVNKVAEYNGAYVAAATQSIVTTAYATFKEDKDVEKVSGDIKTPFVKSHVSVVKEKITHTPNFGNAGAISDPITTYGKVVVKHKIQHPGLAAVIESSEALAKEMFAPK